jgi:hypothetical protein
VLPGFFHALYRIDNVFTGFALSPLTMLSSVTRMYAKYFQSL